MTTRLRQSLLFVAGCVFASLLLPPPATPFDTSVGALVLWLSFYPLAATTTIGAGYWIMLAIGAPVTVVARHYSGDFQGPLQLFTLILFVASLGTFAVRFVRFFMKRRTKE
jgi:hypothetical protein